MGVTRLLILAGARLLGVGTQVQFWLGLRWLGFHSVAAQVLVSARLRLLSVGALVLAKARQVLLGVGALVLVAVVGRELLGVGALPLAQALLLALLGIGIDTFLVRGDLVDDELVLDPGLLGSQNMEPLVD